MKLLLLAATAATLAGGAAQAHGYGGYGRSDLPPPPYAQDGRSYTVYEKVPSKGFPLVGANAGVTVLGLHLGGEAKIRLGVDEELRERRYRRVKVSAPMAPPPVMYQSPHHGYGAPECGECGRW